MKRAGILILATAALVAVASSVVAPATGNSSRREIRQVVFLSTHGFSVDNDPSGPSGGDLFGGAGPIQQAGQRVGKFNSACTLSPPVGGQCQATLIWFQGGRIQLAGNIRLGGQRNVIAIVGGTGPFSGAGGSARLVAHQQGQLQRVTLRILR